MSENAETAKAFTQGQDKLPREELNDRFRKPLMAFFQRRLGNRQEAEDLTQEVFTRLLGVASIEKIERIDSFVFRIAVNLLHDRGRRIARGHETSSLEDDEALIENLISEFREEIGPERVLIGKQTVAEVVKSLNELPERVRNVFVLFRLEGMKQRDIASLYGISQSTVEKYIVKAMIHLSKNLS